MAKGKKTGGRTKGTLNHVTTEIRQLAEGLFDTKYFASLKRRLVKGKVAPAVEVRLLAYAYGEPAKTLNLNAKVAHELKRNVLKQLPDDVLRAIVARDEFEQEDGEVTH